MLFNSSVESVDYSPDGKILVAGNGDNLIRLWDPENGKLLKEIAGHSSGVLAVRVSPDG